MSGEALVENKQIKKKKHPQNKKSKQREKSQSLIVQETVSFVPYVSTNFEIFSVIIYSIIPSSPL